MATKKTFYEILEISAGAADADVRAAYRRQMETLQTEEARLGHDEFKYRQQLLRQALDTLSDPLLRRSYDEKLMGLAPEADAPPQALAVTADGGTMTRRAEVLALRADALALRADALSMHNDILAQAAEAKRPWHARLFAMTKSARAVIGTMAAAVGVVILIQIGFSALYFARGKNIADEQAAKAEEKVVIEEYYRTYGVRPASAAEARQLEKENQRREKEERAAEREKQRAEEETRRFQEESRRLGERVSSDLRNAEERIRREEEYKKSQQEERERWKAAAEEARLEREQARWRAVLSR